ncbi:hypothetical protein J4233_03920 [Candidatus Pacearchaeota archaeon]|nr:hypothetical protein [Candidatus Pacearchaeota archaeon]
MGRRLTTLGLTGLMAVAPTMNGCTTFAPAYDSQGRYIGERRVDDPGKTVQVLGMLNGGLFGLAMQGMGSHASSEQQRRQNEQYRLNTQRQIDQMNSRPNDETVYQNNSGQSLGNAFFACNQWIDSNNNGLAEPTEVTGRKSSFSVGEDIEFVSTVLNYQGELLRFRLYYSDGSQITLDPNIQTSSPINGPYSHAVNIGTLEEGSYTGFWHVRGVILNYTPITVTPRTLDTSVKTQKDNLHKETAGK